MAGGLAHDPFAVFAFERSAICTVGIGLVGQHALRGCAVDHGGKFRTFGAVGGGSIWLRGRTAASISVAPMIAASASFNFSP